MTTPHLSHVTCQIREEWIGRGVIKSCGKLSYDQAQVSRLPSAHLQRDTSSFWPSQMMLECPEKTWTAEELPALSGEVEGGKERKDG